MTKKYEVLAYAGCWGVFGDGELIHVESNLESAEWMRKTLEEGAYFGEDGELHLTDVQMSHAKDCIRRVREAAEKDPEAAAMLTESCAEFANRAERIRRAGHYEVHPGPNAKWILYGLDNGSLAAVAWFADRKDAELARQMFEGLAVEMRRREEAKAGG